MTPIEEIKQHAVSITYLALATPDPPQRIVVNKLTLLYFDDQIRISYLSYIPVYLSIFKNNVFEWWVRTDDIFLKNDISNFQIASKKMQRQLVSLIQNECGEVSRKNRFESICRS